MDKKLQEAMKGMDYLVAWPRQSPVESMQVVELARKNEPMPDEVNLLEQINDIPMEINLWSYELCELKYDPLLGPMVVLKNSWGDFEADPEPDITGTIKEK